ncbi:MAG: serine protease [Nitrosomonas sp.]|nr:serine protease [Nitrosomonas sp.]
MGNSLKLSIALICFIFINSSLSANTETRIINGQHASTASYPWLANLFVGSATDSENGGSCGGSLIDSKWILTAAHCFLNDAGDRADSSAGARTIVTLSSDTLEPLASKAIVVQGKQVFIHPNYNPDPATSSNVNDFDIALLELETTVVIPPVKLFIGETPGNVPTIVAGWGATLTDGTGPSNDLLQTQQITVSENICKTSHGDLITSNMICAGGYTSTDTSDTCQGDSGGPLFINLSSGSLQIGITSFGGSGTANCGTPGSPGVYAKISELYSFIQTHLSNTLVETSLADNQAITNQYDGVNGTVAIPKVYVDDQNYTVTLKHTGNLTFELNAATINAFDNADAVPSFFNAASALLILPLVKVNSQFFNVTLEHLGNFKFAAKIVDPI